jgi:hypothetical protein
MLVQCPEMEKRDGWDGDQWLKLKHQQQKDTGYRNSIKYLFIFS